MVWYGRISYTLAEITLANLPQLWHRGACAAAAPSGKIRFRRRLRNHSGHQRQVTRHRKIVNKNVTLLAVWLNGCSGAGFELSQHPVHRQAEQFA